MNILVLTGAVVSVGGDPRGAGMSLAEADVAFRLVPGRAPVVVKCRGERLEDVRVVVR